MNSAYRWPHNINALILIFCLALIFPGPATAKPKNVLSLEKLDALETRCIKQNDIQACKDFRKAIEARIYPFYAENGQTAESYAARDHVVMIKLCDLNAAKYYCNYAAKFAQTKTSYIAGKSISLHADHVDIPRLLSKACEMGEGAACYEIESYDKGCTLGHQKSCTMKDPEVRGSADARTTKRADEIARGEAYISECEKGNPASCIKAMDLLGDKGRAYALKGAEALITGCQFGSGEVCYMAAQELKSTSLQDLYYQYLRWGCILAHGPSCHERGENFWAGDASRNNPPNKIAAIANFRLACDYGIEKACPYLETPKPVYPALSQDLCVGSEDACFARHLATANNPQISTSQQLVEASEFFSWHCHNPETNNATACYNAAFITNTQLGQDGGGKYLALPIADRGCRLKDQASCQLAQTIRDAIYWDGQRAKENQGFGAFMSNLAKGMSQIDPSQAGVSANSGCTLYRLPGYRDYLDCTDRNIRERIQRR